MTLASRLELNNYEVTKNDFLEGKSDVRCGSDVRSCGSANLVMKG